MKGLHRTLERAAAQSGAGASGSGAAAGTGVTLRDDRIAGGQLRQVTLELVNTPVPLTDEAGVIAYGSVKVFDFPEGAVLFLGAVADLALTKSSAGVIDTWDGDVALGTAAAAADADLTSTEADLIPKTDTPQAVGGATTADCKSTGTESGAVLDGVATAKDAYLNFLVDDADHDVDSTPCNLIVNGTIKLTYVQLGDL